MPPTPIDLSLHSLLPTTSQLPAELTSLAHSLLAQSKIRAAHLKPDEEVGRTYACCEIAVNRLRAKYGLEVGKARPPVRPAVYGKLRGFLEGVLSNEGGKGTPGKGEIGGRKGTESTPTSLRKRWAEARRPKTPVEAGGGKGTRGKEQEVEVPGYAMPMIRKLCRSCGVEKAAPHVFTGVSVVLKQEMGRPQKGGEESGTPGSGKKRKRGAAAGDQVVGEKSAVSEEDVPGIILSIFTTVVRKMYGAHVLEDLNHVEAALNFAKDDKNGLPAATAEENYLEDALERYESSEGGPKEDWTEMEWFDNIPEAAQDTAPENAEAGDEEGTPVRKRQKQAKTPLRRQEKHGKAGDEGDVPGRAGLLPGLGTMFQPAVDWLSEERVLEYARWKREMGREIQAIE